MLGMQSSIFEKEEKQALELRPAITRAGNAMLMSTAIITTRKCAEVSMAKIGL